MMFAGVIDQGAGRALAVGDQVAGKAMRAPIVRDGAARWYALRVQPQHEAQAEAWLRLRGVYAFHPVLPRKVRIYGKVREYHRRYLPGYTFARFSGEPVTHEVLACPFIIGALCLANGVWGVLDQSKLAAIHAMRRVDDAAKGAAVLAAQRRRERMALKGGDAVLFRAGPFAEHKGEVVSLRADGGAVVRLVLFGRQVDIGAQDVDLVPVRKAC